MLNQVPAKFQRLIHIFILILKRFGTNQRILAVFCNRHEDERSDNQLRSYEFLVYHTKHIRANYFHFICNGDLVILMMRIRNPLY